MRHFGTELGTPKPVVFAPEAAASVRKSTLFDPMMLIDFERAERAREGDAAVAPALGPHALAGAPGKRLESLRCDRRSAAFNRILGPLCVKAGLIARDLQLGDAVLQHGVGEIGDTVLDGVV